MSETHETSAFDARMREALQTHAEEISARPGWPDDVLRRAARGEAPTPVARRARSAVLGLAMVAVIAMGLGLFLRMPRAATPPETASTTAPGNAVESMQPSIPTTEPVSLSLSRIAPERAQLTVGNGALVSTQYSPGDRWIVVRTATQIQVIDAQSLSTVISTDAEQVTPPINNGIFSPDDKYFAALSGDRAKLWSLDTKKVVFEVEFNGPPYLNQIALSESRFAFFDARTRDLTLLDLRTMTNTVTKDAFASTGSGAVMRFRPGHEQIFWSSYIANSHKHALYDVIDNSLARTAAVTFEDAAQNTIGWINIVFSPDGKNLWMSTIGEIGGWDADTGKRIKTISLTAADYVQDFVQNTQSALLQHFTQTGASATTTQLSYVLLDLKTGERKPLSAGSTVSNDGTRALSAGACGAALKVFNTESGGLIAQRDGRPPCAGPILTVTNESATVIHEFGGVTAISLNAGTWSNARVQGSDAWGFADLILSVSPDGSRMLVGQFAPSPTNADALALRLLDSASGATIRDIQGCQPTTTGKGIQNLEKWRHVLIDNTTLACVDGFTIRVMNLETGTINTLTYDRAPIAASYNARAGLAAIAAYKRPVRIYDLRDWSLVAEIALDPKAEVSQIVLGDDGRTLALSDTFGAVWAVDWRAGRELWRSAGRELGPETLLTLSADGRYLAFSRERSLELTDDFDIIFVDLISPARAPRRLRGHKAGVSSMAFTPDGNTLVSTGNDLTLRVWKVGQKGS